MNVGAEVHIMDINTYVKVIYTNSRGVDKRGVEGALAPSNFARGGTPSFFS